MPTKYTVRVASNAQYEYWEAESDTFEEMLSAEQELRELKDGGSVPQAVATVTKTFGNTTPVTTSGSFSKPSSFGQGQQAQQSLPDRIELGEHEGYTITLNVKGKFGPYINGYNKDTKDRLKNTNLPKGLDPSQVDLDGAVQILAGGQG